MFQRRNNLPLTDSKCMNLISIFNSDDDDGIQDN